MIQKYYKEYKQDKLTEIDEYKPGSWLNVENATEEDLEKVDELTEDLTSLDLKDALDDYEVPRIERHEGSTLLIFIRNPSQEIPNFHTENLTLVLTEEYFITISSRKNKILEEIKKEQNVPTTQRSKFLINILTKVARDFTRNIKSITNEVQDRSRDLNKIKSEDIVELIENEDILNRYQAALVPLKNVFENLASRDYIKTYEEDEDMLHDMVVSIKQSADLCSVNLKNISALRDAYQIIFTNRLNKTIKFLTTFTIILTVPTVVSSIYGMNVDLPLADNTYAFWILLAMVVSISFLLFLFFYFKRWF
jgi:magnesium transporter